jgi:hypothetical protein
MKKLLAGFLALGLAAAFVPTANAQTRLSFGGISNNSDSNTSQGEQQLTVDVFNAGGGLRNGNQVAFTFMYSAFDSSAITDVYFDDGTLLGLAQVINGPGVLFQQGATPGDLPGGNMASPPFEATAGFTADSDPPIVANGVGNGEFLTLIFDLQAGKTYADVLADLMSGALRIGLHVQGFADGGSESFINNPLTTPIPLPSAVMLGLAGMGGIAARRRR